MYTVEKFEKKIGVEEYIEGYVNVAEFLEYCKKCGNCNTVWSCPPYDFEPEDYWRKYKTLTVLAWKINFEQDISPEESIEILKKVKDEMSVYLYEAEGKSAGSVSLSAGSCSLCRSEGCTRSKGEPCRNPEKMRYSIEAIGGNVGLTVSKLMGIKIEWMKDGKVPSHYVLAGGLLEK